MKRDPTSVQTTINRMVDTPDGARLAVDVTLPNAVSCEPAVLLIHGWAASQRIWDRVRNGLLFDGHVVLSVDLRGHGRSTIGRRPITLDALTDDLELVVERAARLVAATPNGPSSLVDRIVVVGHSGGGYLAAQLCGGHSTFNGSIAGAVLVSSAACAPDSPESEQRLMRSDLLTSVLHRHFVGNVLLAQTMGRGANAETRSLVRTLFACTPPTVRGDVFACGSGADLTDAVERITVPSVVLSGRMDRIVATWRSRDLSLRIRNCEFVVLDDVGHMVPVEAPGVVRSAVRSVTSAFSREVSDVRTAAHHVGVERGGGHDIDAHRALRGCP